VSFYVSCKAQRKLNLVFQSLFKILLFFIINNSFERIFKKCTHLGKNISYFVFGLVFLIIFFESCDNNVFDFLLTIVETAKMFVIGYNFYSGSVLLDPPSCWKLW